MLLIQLLILCLIVFLLMKFIMKVGKSSSPIFIDQEQIVSEEPVFNELPKRPVKNSHWYQHTFMRNRRKG